MIYRRIGDSSVELSVVGVGGHEFLPDGQLRGFQEDSARAITPAHIFAGFGGDRRRGVLAAAYDHGNLADAAGLDRVVPAAHAARMAVIGREAFMKGDPYPQPWDRQ